MSTGVRELDEAIALAERTRDAITAATEAIGARSSSPVVDAFFKVEDAIDYLNKQRRIQETD